MPVNFKIEEAKFFLQKITESYDKSPDNQYYFSAFLSATFSIRDHLLQDYNIKYGLGISMDDKLSLDKFENKAKKQEKKEAIEFILWYKQKIQEIESKTLGKILVKKRHSTIHRQVVHVKNLLEIMFDNQPKSYIDQMKIVNPKYNLAVFYTEEMAYVQLKDCEEMLAIMEKIVLETLAKYPNPFVDVVF